jgi:hypothetical protein
VLRIPSAEQLEAFARDTQFARGKCSGRRNLMRPFGRKEAQRMVGRNDPPDHTWTYQQVAEKAAATRAAIATLGIKMHRDCALSQILKQAEALARDWDASRFDEKWIHQLMVASYSNRISDAIVACLSDPGAAACIHRMCSNKLDLSGREQSKGKDALWELDLAGFFKRRGVSTVHEDPPDLIVDFGFGPYPIACKKVYSERGIESQVRKGARQLQRYGRPGLVAVNFDDLVPAKALLQSQNQMRASEFLARLNQEVIDRNQARLQRFIVGGRCDGILVSTTTLADIINSTPRFNTHTVTTLWTLSSIAKEQSDRIATIRSALEVPPLPTFGS